MDENETVIESPADDLRSSLAESLSQTPPEKPAAEAVTADTETEKTEAVSGDRPRGPDGKFLPKEAGAEEAEKTAAEPAGEQKTEPAPKDGETKTEPEKPAETPPPGVEPPQHWSQADKEKFNAIPAEGRAHFLDMYKRLESWYTPKLQRLSHLEGDYGPIVDMFGPHRDALRQQGKVPADIIKAWAGVEQTLVNHKGAIDSGQMPRGDAAQAVARMIAGYRIDPQSVAEALNAILSGTAPATPSAPASVADPRVDALTEQLQQLTAAENERKAAAQRDSLNGAQRQIDTFANDKDGEGNLKHPFFAELEQDMMLLADAVRRNGGTPNLSELYDRAVWANGSTREKLLSLQKEQEAKRASAEQKARAEAAKRASVSVSGSPAGTQPAGRTLPNNSASVADDLRASMQEARA